MVSVKPSVILLFSVVEGEGREWGYECMVEISVIFYYRCYLSSRCKIDVYLMVGNSNSGAEIDLWRLFTRHCANAQFTLRRAATRRSCRVGSRGVNEMEKRRLVFLSH